jgi:hypothetical protein
VSGTLGKFAIALFLAVTGATGLAACGGGDDSTSGESGSRAVTSAATDPPTPGFEDGSGRTDIPAFGVEADAGDREQVEQVLNAYLLAAGEGEWPRACEYLAESISAELERFAKRSGRGCVASLPHVIDLISKYQNPYFGSVSRLGLRVKESAGAGFALFHGDDGSDYWVAVKIEGGRWRVLSTLPTPLVG